MYFIVLFIASWVLFFGKADRKQWRIMYGVCVFACLLGLLTDLIMVHYRLWDYRGLPAGPFTVPLLLDFSVYPVVTYLFAQEFARKRGIRLVFHVIFWLVVCIGLEGLCLNLRVMEHHLWWNLWLSAASDVIILSSITGLWYYLRKNDVSPTPSSTSSRERPQWSRRR